MQLQGPVVHEPATPKRASQIMGLLKHWVETVLVDLFAHVLLAFLTLDILLDDTTSKVTPPVVPT
jgi:hypothetical protein